jgi:cytochrome c-type biogenesis protein CcmH/NrfG
MQDAIDAYTRAAELDPNNQIISQRLAFLKQQQSNPK